MATPAKSARLQLLQGNPAKKNTDKLKRRAENEEKLKMRSINVRAPNWLDEVAKREFKRVAELLLEVELINEADIAHLALYCDAYSQYIGYKEEVENTGLWIDGKPNPFIIRMRDAATQVRQFASDLGLSPQARAKLAINLADGEDDDDDF